MIKHIIFDLGNVLIDIHPERALQQFSKRCAFTIDTVREFFKSPIYWDHMAGLYPPETFYRKVIETYPCQLSQEEFKEIWNTVIGLAKIGIEPLIHKLKKDYVLSVCSNTDPWHWEKVEQEVSFISSFQYYFLSFQMRKTKPDPEVFSMIPEKLECTADECIFIDDTSVNIEQASQSGFNTILASNSNEISEGLKKMKILGED
jgi:putative hydrolase of the HAD superfamily